ncbi:hypothetical protein GQ600_10294 [Phytophthora cactorum]|nr:hypothetical protein GQ600_10294 [Phytophthora cactorum]
MQYSAR